MVIKEFVLYIILLNYLTIFFWILKWKYFLIISLIELLEKFLAYNNDLKRYINKYCKTCCFRYESYLENSIEMGKILLDFIQNDNRFMNKY